MYQVFKTSLVADLKIIVRVSYEIEPSLLRLYRSNFQLTLAPSVYNSIKNNHVVGRESRTHKIVKLIDISRQVLKIEIRIHTLRLKKVNRRVAIIKMAFNNNCV